MCVIPLSFLPNLNRSGISNANLQSQTKGEKERTEREQRERERERGGYHSFSNVPCDMNGKFFFVTTPPPPTTPHTTLTHTHTHNFFVKKRRLPIHLHSTPPLSACPSCAGFRPIYFSKHLWTLGGDQLCLGRGGPLFGGVQQSLMLHKTDALLH